MKHDNKHYVDSQGIVRISSSNTFSCCNTIGADDFLSGGTTCTLVVQIRDNDDNNKITLITANVGDSNAILLSKSKSNFELLSVDHGPENSNEYMRIKSLPDSEFPHKLLMVYDIKNCKHKYDNPLLFDKDGTLDPNYLNSWSKGAYPTNARYEPAVYAVSPKGSRIMVCIAMTRSLGDFNGHALGFTCEPSIGVKHLNASDNDFSVIIASDGIWDCWHNEEFIKLCIEANTTANIATNNVKETGEIIMSTNLKKAKQLFGKKNYDDTSMVMWNI